MGERKQWRKDHPAGFTVPYIMLLSQVGRPYHTSQWYDRFENMEVYYSGKKGSSVSPEMTP